MLNGRYPLIIFNFKKLIPQLNVSGIPLLSAVGDSIPLIPIPLPLEEKRSGVYIDTENKHLDIRTDVETLPDGSPALTSQRGIDSVVTVNMMAKKDSAGLALLSAMADIVFDKVTSEEYSITYINGAVIVFGGVVNNFSIVQRAHSDLCDISLSISRVTGKTTKATPKKDDVIVLDKVAQGGVN